MTDRKKLLLFAESDSQLPSLVNFAKLSGAESIDYAVLDGVSSEQKIAINSEELAKDLSDRAKDDRYGIIALLGTKLGREIAPRLAVLLHSGYVEGVTDICSDGAHILFQRLTLGGTCVEKINVKTPTAIVTVQPGRDFIADATEIVQNEIQIFSDNSNQKPAKELLEERPLESSENIQSAKRIVAIGRGIKRREDISLIEELARVLNASIGVTRPLVEDLKWYSREKQIGLSGNSVKPALYLGLGISGQVQHIVGMRDSKIVVAVNKDKTAPILSFADYSIIGDLYAIVPEMIKQLKEEKSSTTRS